MALDIRGGRKNTKLNGNPYVVLEELLSNALDSFLIRRAEGCALVPFRAEFIIELIKTDILGDETSLRVTCIDNGAGFGPRQRKAFTTKDTTFKDDLAISGIKSCKGAGRIQFFHYFERMQIDSTYIEHGKFERRVLAYNNGKELAEEEFLSADVGVPALTTTVVLDRMRDEVANKVFKKKSVSEYFGLEDIRRHIMVTFLPRLVHLKEVLGPFEITLRKDPLASESAVLSASDLPSLTSTKRLEIGYQSAEGSSDPLFEEFWVSHYKLDSGTYSIPNHVVALCARSAVVKDVTKDHLKSNALITNPIRGYYHLVLVESPYLDRHVNEQRSNFENIPDRIEDNDIEAGTKISSEQINAALTPVIDEMLAPPDWDKSQIVRRTNEKYGISAQMIAEAGVRVHFGDTEEDIATRVLRGYAERIVEETTQILDFKTEMLELDPTSTGFREKVNEIAWKYTTALHSIDMANLSQLIVRRTAIIEILRLAVDKMLAIQAPTEGKRNQDEKVIHSIFFPMGKDSDEVTDHDLWLMGEEYNYFRYVSSNKSLSTIRLDNGEPLFEDGADEGLEEICKNIGKGGDQKKPDIAIFLNEGAVVIMEFKAPDVELDYHVGDLTEYSRLLLAKSKGRLKRFYGYLLGTTLNENRMQFFTRFPSGRGWFATTRIEDNAGGRSLGELYMEVLFYGDLADRASKRLDVYRERLQFRP
jgi:hypothetical protein